MLPNFIIIGAMNSGTTSLYNYLKAHPEIIPSRPKEPTNFVQDRFTTKGLAWYRSIFKGVGRYAFETSANYSKRHLFPGVPKRMHQVVPEIKLIYLLRDPIERAKSHYMWVCAHGLEEKQFSIVIKDFNCNLIKTGQYFYQLEAYLEYLPKERILTIDSHLLSAEPIETVKGVLSFLNIPEFYIHENINKKYNQSKQWKYPTAIEKYFLDHSKNYKLRLILKILCRRFGKFIKRPKLTLEDRDILVEAFEKDVKQLRKFTGNAFSHWSILSIMNCTANQFSSL